MKIHYFQRYHEKENVATANTMLLLSRLHAYSSDKFFRFLKSEYFSDSFNPEIIFTLQEKSVDSVPDATITQESFKIVVETKMSDWFYEDQLLRHLNSFSDEKYKVMITLAPELMEENKKAAFEEKLKQYNESQRYPVIHINTTFEAMANAIGDILDDRDYDMQDVLADYLNYCYTDGLIPVSDAWKYMRMQLAGATFDFNISSNVLEKVKYEIVLKSDDSLSTINDRFVKIYVTDDNDKPINDFYSGMVPTFYDLKVSETDPGAKVIYSGVLKNKNVSKIRVRMWVADNHEISFNSLVFSTKLDVNIK